METLKHASIEVAKSVSPPRALARAATQRGRATAHAQLRFESAPLRRRSLVMSEKGQYQKLTRVKRWIVRAQLRPCKSWIKVRNLNSAAHMRIIDAEAR